MKNLYRLTFCLLVGLMFGCGKPDYGPPKAPNEASELIVQARDLLLEVSTGGVPFKGKADLKPYDETFPLVKKAVEGGELVIVFGKTIKDNSPTPEVIAYETSAEKGEGWAVKDDGKVYKVSSQDLPKGK